MLSSRLLIFCECRQGGCGFFLFLHDLSNRWVSTGQRSKNLSSGELKQYIQLLAVHS